MTKEEIKEKGLRMFSLLIPIEDFKQLELIRTNMKYSTIAQAVKHLLYNPVTLQDAESITLKK
jgi:hypothetical protein